MKLARVPRRPDHWSSPHERARVRAAERMDAPLEPAEAAWLDEHLAGCADCRSVADAYAADQDALRGLRATAPEPPRDLWARTAAGIEQEAARRGRPLTASAAGRGFRIPVGMLGGITVVAVVLGATAMSGGWLSGPSIQGAVPTTATRPSQGTVAAAATPMNVDAGDVGWVATTGDGTLAYHAAVNQVCPAGDQPDCPTVEREPVAPPRPGHRAQDHHQRPGPAARDRLRLGPAGRRQGARHDPARPSDPDPESDPDRDGHADLDPDRHAHRPCGQPDHDAQLGRERDAGDDRQHRHGESDPDRLGHSDGHADGRADRVGHATAVAHSGADGRDGLAIASGVKVVGQAAAFSPDGDWFAFSARPSDGSTGPDVYVWRVGDDAARPLTKDHRTVFSSWQGDRIIASRPTTARPRPTTSRRGPSRSIPQAASRPR